MMSYSVELTSARLTNQKYALHFESTGLFVNSRCIG